MAKVTRIFVKGITSVGEEREAIAVPLADESLTVEDLTTDLLTKLQLSSNDSKYEIRLLGAGVLLKGSSIVQDVVKESEYLLICPKGYFKKTGDGSYGITKSMYSVEQQQIFLANSHAIETIDIDGCSLTIEDLMSIGCGLCRVALSQEAVDNVTRSRKLIDDIIEEGKVVYGVNTGFGRFARVSIPKEDTVKLQDYIVRSHASCVGPPLSPMRTRLLLTLRINVLAKGYSGIRLETLQQLIGALNASCLSHVPEKGTVGASGDLAPLSHLALGLMGEGEMWGPKTGWGDAKEVLSKHGLKPIQPQAKEGLALINGTQFITALGCEALYRAEMIAKQADIVAALSIDVLQGTPTAFDRDIHHQRPHNGQQMVAARLRSVLDSKVHPSEIREGHKNCDRVQDAYTMRCVPQVHGVVHDTIAFVRGILSTEINSATDNPMVFSKRGELLSCGNFHGEYPAKSLDYLAIGIHEIANISERRLERLIHPGYSGLPAFLVKDGGLNSGFMLAQCTAAALVSENKVLTHPSSVDSITTSAGTEDHVSMGGFAARKALSVVEHVEQVVAIELLAGCQALEFHRPKKTTAPLEAVYKLVRTVVRDWNEDRFFAPDITAVTKLLQEGKIWETVAPFIKDYEEKQVNT